MTAYPWYLEKTSKKYRCPSCKAEKRFKRYVFAHNNEYIHDLVGRCDRENSCGYHYSPKEYFACSPFPLPPLAEQKAIVYRVEKLLSMVNELEKQVFERKEQSEQLMQAVLREAFEGGK